MLPVINNEHEKGSALQLSGCFRMWDAEQFFSFLFAFLYFLMFYMVNIY